VFGEGGEPAFFGIEGEPGVAGVPSAQPGGGDPLEGGADHVGDQSAQAVRVPGDGEAGSGAGSAVAAGNSWGVVFGQRGGVYGEYRSGAEPSARGR